VSCRSVRLPDGSFVLANLKPGAKISDADKRTLAEWVEFCRERRARRNEEQCKSNPIPSVTTQRKV